MSATGSSSKEPISRRTGRTARGLEAVEDYAAGPDASIEATAAAMAKVEHARSIVLVEGVSDQAALETLAERLDMNLAGDGVVVVPIGGANAIAKFLRRFNSQESVERIVGLCDSAEAVHYRRALDIAPSTKVDDNGDLEAVGFFVCVEDLEDELIRAVGQQKIEDVLTEIGDIGSFRTLQKQPAWQDAPFEAQMRRYLGAGARRKLRYAHLLVEALDLRRVPAPLEGVLASA